MNDQLDEKVRKYLRSIAKKAAGKSKVYSDEEILLRTARLARARAIRSEKLAAAKYAAKVIGLLVAWLAFNVLCGM